MSGKDGYKNPLDQGLRLYVEGKEDPEKLAEARDKFDTAYALARFYGGLVKLQLEGENMEDGARELMEGMERLLQDEDKAEISRQQVLRTLHQALDGLAQNDFFEPDETVSLHEEETPSFEDIQDLLRAASPQQKEKLEAPKLRALHKATGAYLRRFSSVVLGGKIV